MATFVGWVPNVAGKLSFTLSGTAAYPRKFNQSGNLIAGGRYFIGHQHRNLSDTTLPFFSDWPSVQSLIDNFVFNKDGNFIFLCLLKVASDRESARGRIYAYDRVQWRACQTRLEEGIRSVAQGWDTENILLHEALPTECLSQASYSGRFQIHRNGVTEIETLAMPQQLISRMEHAFAAQAYFCLRDLLHTHRFHHPSSDTIIDVYPDLATMKKQVNYGLMRRAISARRVETVEAQQRALGIISYLRAFRENIMTDEERREIPFSLDAVIASINAGIPLIAAREKRSWRHWLDQFRGTAIAFVSAVFGYAALIEQSKVLVPEKLWFLKSAFAFIQQRFGIALICIVLFIFFLQTLLSLKSDKRDRITKTSSRLALAFSVRRYGLFEIVLASIFLGCGLAIVWLMINKALSGPDQAAIFSRILYA